jgi:hypothetical protein
MAFESDTSIHIIAPHKLEIRQINAIRSLVGQSIMVDYPNRSTEEHAYFVAHNTIGHPNRGIGGPLLRAKQAYANIHNILVVQDDEPIVHLPMADNASSRKPFLLGAAEIQAKLHLDEFRGRSLVDRRYVWSGYVALAENVRREIIASDGQEFTELDAAYYHGFANHKTGQRLTNYPWDEEEALRVWLPTVGLHVQPGQDSEVHAFGRNAAPVHQERALGESVAHSEELILAKDGALKAIRNSIRTR